MTAPSADADEARRLGIVPAASGIRSLAFAIDAALAALLVSPAVLALVLGATDGPSTLTTVLLVVGGSALVAFFAVQLAMHGRRGVTVGKAAMRLRSIRETTYARPGFWRIVLRAVVLGAGCLVPLVGPAVLFASSLWDPRRRGRSILDRTAGCWLIDARAGLDPFDATALRRARRALADRPDGLDERLPSMATGADAGSALRITPVRSRAGVVGGGTGAQWALAAELAAPVPIDQLPAAPLVAVPPVDAAAASLPAAAPGPVAPTALPGAPDSAPTAAVPGTVAPDSAAPAPATRRRGKTLLRFDDGTTVRVAAAGLIGRDPVPDAGEADAVLVPLTDPQRLMSKTHLAFGEDADGVWVTDRGSRNGTQLISPSGHTIDAVPGERTRVPAGWTVQVGGRSFAPIPRGERS